MSQIQKQIVKHLLNKADIRINGNRDWDIIVNNDKLYSQILAKGSLGFGEAYMDGWWDCKAIDQMIDRILRAGIDKKVLFNWPFISSHILSRVLNRQAGKRSYEVGKRHYDVGNDLYKCMLDKRMTYSCGYWQNVDNLDDAQEAKLDLICRKLGLEPGMRVLDIGSGWGSWLKYAAEKYKIKGLGLTISKEQAKYSQDKLKGLPVEIRLQDYHQIKEKFDRIVSIGMFEHVGYKNYRDFMKVVNRNLELGGLQMLHTIGSDIWVRDIDPWIEKYIFPNSMLPTSKQITKATEGLFVVEDWHNFGTYYDKTLMAWHQNFIGHWEELKDGYSETFKRMWTFYLLTSAGSFRSGKSQLWQIVLSKGDLVSSYQSIR